MGWVVTSWRHEDRARQLIARAEREARATRRAAARATAEAAAQLAALEALGEETRRRVQDRRRSLAARRADVEPTVARAEPAPPPPLPVDASPVVASPLAAPRARRRPASMRNSNLADLFKATAKA